MLKNNKFHTNILMLILSIAILSGLASFFLFSTKNYLFATATIVFVIFLITKTITYFNKINKQITFFLLGIENEDTTLKIPEKTGNKVVDELFEGINHLNELFKKTKIDITTQEYYYRSVINQSATGLFSVNSDKRILNINPAAEKLTGLSHYHHINSLERINAELPEIIVNSNVSGKTSSAIYENANGQKLLFKITEIKTSKENIKLVAVSDITKELDNSEIDAWIKLARTLSHEIMNNITPITTLSQVILNYFKHDNTVVNISALTQDTIKNSVKGLEVIEERSIGLVKFVNNYRKFTKLPEPVFTQTNVSELLEKAIVMASTYKGFEHITLRKSIPEKIIRYTDDNLLSQVFINLLKNAVEALQENTPDIESILKVRIVQASEKLRIEVSNNGPEIPLEICEQIFVPFFTTKEKGSGIGLSLSKQIMLKMNGDIHLKTDTQTGFTCFNVFI